MILEDKYKYQIQMQRPKFQIPKSKNQGKCKYKIQIQRPKHQDLRAKNQGKCNLIRQIEMNINSI